MLPGVSMIIDERYRNASHIHAHGAMFAKGGFSHPKPSPIRVAQSCFSESSSGVMNSFFVPQLGSQIYTMAGMITRLHLQADHPGTYRGFSAQFSGDGFSDMRFIAKAVPAGDFNAWREQVRGTGSALDDAGYAELAKPSKAVPPTTYRSVEPNLFDRIIDKTVAGPEKAGVGADWCPPRRQAGG